MEKSGWDNVEVIPFANRLQRVSSGIRRMLELGRVTELCLSEHKNTGASVMLDEELDYQPRLPLAYDSEGRYLDENGEW